MRRLVLVIALLCLSPNVRALEDDAVYRGEIAVKVKAAIASIGKAKTEAAKIDEMKKLKAELASEKERVRKELDRATEAKSEKEKLTKLDAKDNEIVRIWYSMSPVFEKTLEDSFVDNAEFRRTACNSIPTTVKFNDMAAMPEGSDTPAWTQLSLDLTTAICSRSQEQGR